MSETAPEPELVDDDIPAEEGDAGVNDTGDESWYETGDDN